MSSLVKLPARLPPKATPKVPSYNNYIVKVNVDNVEIGDIYSKFSSSTYNKINEILNNNFNFNFRNENGENLAFAIVRNVDGVLGNSESLEVESFETELLEAPSFTKPQIYNEKNIPSEFLKGNHSKIRSLKSALSECKTSFFRPEKHLKHNTRKSYEK